MDFPQTKKMSDLRTGDIFVRNDFTYIAIADTFNDAIWVTTTKYVNEKDVYGYTSAILLQYKPDDKVKVIGKDERPLNMLW